MINTTDVHSGELTTIPITVDKNKTSGQPENSSKLYRIVKLPFRPIERIFTEEQHKIQDLLTRLTILGLSTTSLVYLFYFLNGKTNALNQWINSWMNPTFVNFLQNSSWVTKLLIALLITSIALKFLALYLKENNMTETKYTLSEEGISVKTKPLDRLSTVNTSYNMRNVCSIAAIGYIPILFIFCKLSDRTQEKVCNTFSGVELLTKKVITAGIIAICTTSILACFQHTKTWMGFNVVPEFIQNTKWMLITATTLLGMIALAFVYNCIVDLFNIAGKTIQWRGFEKPILETKEMLENNHDKNYAVIKKENTFTEENEQGLHFPLMIRELDEKEEFNRRVGDVASDCISFVIDKVTCRSSGRSNESCELP